MNNTVYDLFPANLEFLTLSLKLSEVDLGVFWFFIGLGFCCVLALFEVFLSAKDL